MTSRLGLRTKRATSSLTLLISSSRASPPLLLGVLRLAFQMKALLTDNDAVSNKIAGQAYVENFALKVFAGADDEDRAGKATPYVPASPVASSRA